MENELFSTLRSKRGERSREYTPCSKRERIQHAKTPIATYILTFIIK
jgi:hypothetical protein